MKLQSDLHVFISFKTDKKERSTALQLKNNLNKSGFKVWWQEEIQCGQEWHGAIDKAIEEAGAILVLWSSKSMVSTWVKHEASQAIVKQVYTPARIEVMEIDSPYNRIQAIDLIDWNGDPNHPGYQNLVKRLKKLMPAPLSFWQKATQFTRKHFATIVISFITILALFLIVRQSGILQSQITQQAKIALEIDRTLHPIKDFEFDADIKISPSTPGTKEYLSYLHSKLIDKSTNQLKKDLPQGVDISTGPENNTEEISISRSSGLWPSLQTDTNFFYLVNYINLSVKFSIAEDKKEINNSDTTDLAIEVSSYNDNDENLSKIVWNTKQNSLTIHFTDNPDPQDWTSNGKVISVPDIEKAVISIHFINRMLPQLNNEKIENALLTSRGNMTLSNFYIHFSGKQLLFRNNILQNKKAENGLNIYTSPVSNGQDMHSMFVN